MPKKKISSHWYTPIKTKYHRGSFQMEELPDGCLYAQGQYATKLTEADLPEWFVEVYLRGKRFVDVKNLADIAYKPSFWSDNHLFKDDFLYITYKDKLRWVEEDGRISTWGRYENYDLLLWGWSIKTFVDAAVKYAEGDMLAKLKDIQKRIRDKMTWYVHIDPMHNELSNDEMPVKAKAKLIVRPMEDRYRPLTDAQQIEAMRDVCAKRNIVEDGIIYVIDKADMQKIADELPSLDIDAIVRPVFLYVQTDHYGDPDYNSDPFEQEWFRTVRRDKASTCSVFCRAPARDEQDAEK